MQQSGPTIQLLLTGNELMSGDTIDSNSSMIAQRLSRFGLQIARKVTLGDAPEALAAELEDLSEVSDVVIVNGGLGPTDDDLTAEILASVSGTTLVENAEARSHVEAWCARRGAIPNAANLKQALLPEGSVLLDNPVGSAVGFQMILKRCLVICTPGVPSELRAMLDEVVENMAMHLGEFTAGNTLRLQTFGLGESAAQQAIKDSGFNWPEAVTLGFRAGAPQMEIKLSIPDPAHVAQQQACRDHLEQLFGDHIIGEAGITLGECVLDLLTRHNKTVTTAESCTGGLIASMLTAVPGSSAAFHAGFVTYADAIKASVLGVSETTLTSHGAVSEAVVIEMARGALQRANADFAIAVSGVAGPGGGSAEKPVGTVWLAWGSDSEIRTKGLLWPVERTLFQTMIAAAGLDMLRRTLLGIDSEPRYFTQRSQD